MHEQLGNIGLYAYNTVECQFHYLVNK